MGPAGIRPLAPGRYHRRAYVVQPVTREQMAGHDSYRPALQVRMFTAGAAPSEAGIGAMAEQARRAFASVPIVAG